MTDEDLAYWEMMAELTNSSEFSCCAAYTEMLEKGETEKDNIIIQFRVPYEKKIISFETDPDKLYIDKDRDFFRKKQFATEDIYSLAKNIGVCWMLRREMPMMDDIVEIDDHTLSMNLYALIPCCCI